MTQIVETTDHQDSAQFLADIQNALRAGDQVRAAGLISDWLRISPGNSEALYFRAVIERTAGHFDAALNTLNQLLLSDPLHSRALQESGHVRLSLNDPRAALSDYQRASKLNPSLVASWSAQARLLKHLGFHDAAQKAADEVAFLKALPPPLLIVMDLISRGRLGKAEELCKRFMQKNPAHVDGMRLLAEIAIKFGALDDATLLLSTAEELKPTDSRVAIDYIQLLGKQQQFDEALKRATRLSNNDPRNLQFRSLLAIQSMQIGQYEQAIEAFNEILNQAPGDPVTLTSRGHALKTCGQTDEAVASYRSALASQASYGEAWHALANLKTYAFNDDDIAQMESLCASPQIDFASHIFLHFALGKAYEDKADYQCSFSHYEAGNKAKKRQSSYRAAQITEEFEQQKFICNERLFDKFHGSGHLACDPIFIVGLPRAGSTLLEQILASHSQVDGTLELPNVLSLAQSLRRLSDDITYPEILNTLKPDDYRTFGETFIRDTAVHRQGAPFFIDKMPNNFRHIGLIKLMLPNAKIIDARRNPMACCFSGYKQLFAEGQEFSYDLTDIGAYYRDYIDLMTHWDAVLPGQILRVNNEDIIADLEGQVRRILEFCGLSFENDCVEYWRTERAVKTPSSEQVRRPVTDAGQHQWRNYEPWLGQLSEALGTDLAKLSK